MKAPELHTLYTAEGMRLPDVPWQEYPRPQLSRDSFLCLNGTWDFEVTRTPEIPYDFTRTVLVPFAPESPLSGVGEVFDDGAYLFYRLTFSLPTQFIRDRVLLHFGAVDQMASVYLNGTHLGEHVGGYEPFSFDITEHLAIDNTLIVRVRDELSTHVLPYGKQRRDRGGMWYTPTTGIWQTVWCESVPERYIRSLRTDRDGETVTLTVEGESSGRVLVTTPSGVLGEPLVNGTARLRIPSPRLWSPEDPYLYRFTVEGEGGDLVSSYFALRTLDIRTVDGIARLCLNGKPYVFHGLLDQGYFSDGHMTPASPTLYERDILYAKSLGFNMLRKHIKIEPELFYYACDRLGVVVFQDMVNNGDYSFLRDTALPTVLWKRRGDRRLHRDKRTREAFLDHMDATASRLYHHPSVCYYTIFNEGWGQFNSTAAYRRLKALDPTRFIDSASGWFTGGESDVISHHVYFKPFRLRRRRVSAAHPTVLSEFGGIAYGVDGHRFNTASTYGYGTCQTREAFVAALRTLYERDVLPAIQRGLCAAVYTQLSDVEDEVNGLITYDRAVPKVHPEEFLDISERITSALLAEGDSKEHTSL